MPKTTNPRKVTTSGGMTVVSIPEDFLATVGLEKGDRVVLTAAENGFEAEKVEWSTVNNE